MSRRATVVLALVLGAVVVACLSWVYEQTRLPDPEPEPEGPWSADVREWAQESRAVADAALMEVRP